MMFNINYYNTIMKFHADRLRSVWENEANRFSLELILWPIAMVKVTKWSMLPTSMAGMKNLMPNVKVFVMQDRQLASCPHVHSSGWTDEDDWLHRSLYYLYGSKSHKHFLGVAKFQWFQFFLIGRGGEWGGGGGGRNSSLVVFGLAVHSVAGSILLWGHFPVERIFPLEFTWVQTPFPQKLFRMRV